MDDKQLETMIGEIEEDVFKDYVHAFSEYSPKKINNLNLEEWKERHIRNIKINKLIKSIDDKEIDDLCQLYQSFSGEKCTIGLLFHHTIKGIEVHFRIADIRENVSNPSKINELADRANRIFNSTFSGAEIVEVTASEDVLRKARHVAAVTNFASEKNDLFISLDNLFNYHDGSEYSVLMLAEPISDNNTFKDAFDKLNTYLTNISPYESEQIANNNSITKNTSIGAAFFVSANTGKSETDGITVSKTISNHSVKHMMEHIGKSLERVELCKALGGWNFATYILSDYVETTKNVAYQYDALVRGKESNVVSSAINSWEKEDAETIFDYLVTNRHPIFRHGDKEKDLSVLVSSIDLAHAMNFPRSSVPGFTVAECASFGRNISLLDGDFTENLLNVGKLWHMRHDDGTVVTLNQDLLTSHVFVSGSTGSGKSNTVYQLLNLLKDKTFLVVEPTKGEYKSIFGGREDVTVYSTNPSKSSLLRINPFSFPEGIQLYAHIDKLIEIFNACWPMYAAMPAILKDAVERAYVKAGWDLKLSKNINGIRLFPSFVDVLNQIDLVLNESDYSGESKGDYKGALKTRLKSLSNGIFGLIFGCDEIPEADLYDKNVIVDLSEIGSETTSLIMGMIVLKLHEYRSVSADMNSELKHVTVLEEAHNLLKRTSTDQSVEGSNLVGKSVEMITNAIAEMRTYGEGFVIVDQAPGVLDPAAIRNTNTKIVLRLPDYSDRELVGKSIGLTEEQIIELSRLERGVAAVYQSGWTDAVLCKFEKYDNEQPLQYYQTDISKDNTASILLGAVLYGGLCPEIRNTIYSLKNRIITSGLPVEVKQSVYRLCVSETEITEFDLAAIAYNLIEADKMYVSDKPVDDKALADRINAICNKYQITGRTMEKESLNWLMLLIENEHQRRLEEWMHLPVKGVMM